MKVRAAILEEMGREPPYAQSKPLTLGDIELDGPGPGEVLVKMAAAGLCHSDLSVIDGNRPRPTPMVLGHEASGIVEEVGPRSARPAARATTSSWSSCRAAGTACPARAAARRCANPPFAAGGKGTLLSGEKRMHRGGHDVNHMLGVSAFAEYATCSRRSADQVDPDIPLDQAALFGCAVLTGVGAVSTPRKIEPGSTSPWSASAASAFRAFSALSRQGRSAWSPSISPTTSSPWPPRSAPTDTFKSGEGDAQAIKDATGGGLHYVFEMAGAVPALDLAYRITRRGGTTVTAGLPNPNAMLSLQALSLIGEERTLKGSYMGSAVPTRDIPRYISLFRRGKLPVDRLLTGTITLDQINEGFDALREGRAIRQIITFG